MPPKALEAEDIGLTLRYSGDRASSGELDAYDLSGAIEGFSDFVLAVGTARFGEDFDIQPSITALSPGSFNIAFLLHLLSSDVASLLYSAMQLPDGFGQFIKLLAEVFDLLKHLKGEPPKKVESREGGVHIENNNGVVNIFSREAYAAVTDPSVSRAARKFAGKPLERSATQIQIISKEKVIAYANRDESGSFVAIDTGDVLAEHVNEVHLTIQTAVLEGKNRWKFNDGSKTFSASIEDNDFLAGVARGREAFRRGDELVVKMRSTQKRVNGQLKAEYAIEKVVRHTTASLPPERLL